MSSSVERTVSGRTYIYRVDQVGEPELIDETNDRTKYESDVSRYLPPATPKLTKKGKVAVRKPYVAKRSFRWWKAHCGFRGLPVGGSVSDLQARIRSHGNAGLAPKIKEAFESMGKEFLEKHYNNRSDDEKANLLPRRFLQDVFGPQSSRREEVVVVEIQGWGEPMENAARELKVSCEMKKMPGYERGQRRVVVGLNAMEVRAKMAEFDIEAQRAAQRARRELEEKKEKAQDEFEEEFELAKAKESKVEGLWNVNGTWKVSCPYIDEGWDSEGQECGLKIGTTDSNSKGLLQMYADFDFNIITGIMRFVSPSATSTTTNAADFLLSAEFLPSSTNKTVHFRWRGEETGEGEIQLDVDEESCSITFHSPDAFTGTFIGGLVGTATFEGIKVNEKASRVDPKYAWESRDEEAYESARVGRWR